MIRVNIMMGGMPDPASGSLSARVLSQLPATVWTTDRNLVVTFFGSPALPAIGLDRLHLVGAPLTALVSDGGQDHPILEAHRGALMGRVEQVCLEWGDYTFAGQVAPLREPAGEIIGCVGCGQMRARDVTVDALIGTTRRRRWHAGRRARRRGGDLPALLQRLIADFAWDGATVWTVGNDDGLSRLVSVGRTPAADTGEPHAWLASTTNEWQTDTFGGWFVPIVADRRGVGVLGVYGQAGDPREDGSSTLIDVVARDLAGRLGPTATPGRPRRRPMLVVLAACLIPMPVVFSSCYVASAEASLVTTRSLASRAAVTMPFSTAVADEWPCPTTTSPGTPSSGAPPYRA